VRTLLEVVVAQQLDVGVAHLVDEAEHGGRRALPQPALLLLLETVRVHGLSRHTARSVDTALTQQQRRHQGVSEEH
jgi:hypothetical protein